MVEQLLTIETRFLGSGKAELLLQTPADVGRIVKLGPYPIPVMLLCRLVSRSATAKWIENQVSRICGDKNSPFWNDQFQLVDAGAHFEPSVTVRGRVRPEIGKIHAFGIHLVAMASVITDLLAAMATSLDGKSELVKHARRAARVVKERVVGWVELLASRIRSLHRYRDPMPEIKALTQNRGKLDGQFWRGVEKESPAGLDDATTLLNPLSAPLQILTLGNAIIVAVLVILADIEGGVSENGVNHARFHSLQYLEAVGIEESSVGSGEKRLIHSVIIGKSWPVSRRISTWANVPDQATANGKRR